MSAPTLTRSEAVLQAGEELLQELSESGRVRSVEHLADLRAVVVEASFEAEEQEVEQAARRERGRFWRERMPALAEAMATPRNERWKAHQVATMAAELGLHEDRVDIPSLAREGAAGAAYVAPMSLIRSNGALHRDLGIPEGQEIPEKRIAAATKQPGEAGSRARLAVALLAQARRSARR
jgi:hypothetical protein